ncbi:chaplin [Kitasatospora sp. NPDC004240]
MNTTKKFVASAALGAALVLVSAAPALAADGDAQAVATPVSLTAPLQQEDAIEDAVAAAIADALALDGAAGTVCINQGSATAEGVVAGSPGVLSGNQIQIPINAQFNICGNSVSLLG